MSIDFGCCLWPQNLTSHLGTDGHRLPKERGVLQQAALCISVESMYWESGEAAGPGTLLFSGIVKKEDTAALNHAGLMK